MSMFTIITFIILLSVLVLIHELGHYLVARKFGIKVEEFGFGFPPRVWGVRKGETLYSINLLPIGGFVKLYGEDDAGGGRIGGNTSEVSGNIPDVHRAFFARSAAQRAWVVVAGVIMNVLLAAFIFYIYLFITNFTASVPLLGNFKFFLVHQRNVSQIIITDVANDSPAKKAGIAPLMQVVQIDGQNVNDPDKMISYINSHKGKLVTLELETLDTKKMSTAQIVPRVNPPKGEGPLGVALDPLQTAELSYDTPVEKVLSGFTHPINMMIYQLDVFKYFIQLSIKQHTSEPVRQSVSGPIGIYSAVNTIVQIPNLKERILEILNLAGLMSISLAFFNVLPIPALDGGRLFFILIELVTHKKVNPKYEVLAHTIGFAVLIMLVILISANDIGKLFGK